MNKLQEYFDYISLNLIEEDFQKIKNMPENDFSANYHHSLGRFLRNNLSLWDKESENYNFFVGLGLSHPDDMSGLIMHSYHRHINDKPLDIEEQVEYYKEYWLSYERLKDKGSFNIRYDINGRITLHDNPE